MLENEIRKDRIPISRVVGRTVRNSAFEFINLVADGDRVFVTYEGPKQSLELRE